MDDMTDEASTTTSASELTPADERIAVLERLAALRPELRQTCQEMIDLERNRERCRQIEAKTRVTLPDDKRGSGAPPPSSTSAAAPSPERPSGWARFDAIGPPPGIDHVDRLCAAQDVLDRAAREREYKQYFLDRFHEAKLNEKEYAREQAERRSFHKAPGDSDFKLT